MNVAQHLRDRAACIEESARYEHERDYAEGLRAAADILESTDPWPITTLVTAVRQAPHDDYRRGLLKALDIAEGQMGSMNTHLRLERLETAVESLRTTVVGAMMARRCMHAFAVDLRNDDGTEASG